VIINVRGTSGSGKTTAVMKLLKMFPNHPFYDKEGKTYGHRIDVKYNRFVFVVGPYRTSCSGCDRLKSQDQVCELVTRFSKWGDVLFEGYRTSGSVQRYVNLAHSLPNHQFLFAFMNTPLKKCLQRLQKRRKKNNLTKPLSKGHIISTYNRLQKMPAVLKDLGMRIETLPYRRETDAILRLILAPRRFSRPYRFPRTK